MDGEDQDESMVSQAPLYEGRVVEVSDPQNFWIQIAQVGGLDAFRQLTQELSLFAERVGTLTGLGGLEKSVYILVQSRDKDKPMWMRAQISRINHELEEIDVFFNDYGQTEKVSCSQICAACPMSFFTLPWQAWKCGLAGIKPISQTWTRRAIRQFKILTMDQVLRVAIIAFHSLVHLVGLYTADGDSVTHKLLEEEIGLPDSLEMVPSTASEVVFVLPVAYMHEALAETEYEPEASEEMTYRQSGLTAQQEESETELYFHQEEEAKIERRESRNEAAPSNNVIPEFDVGLITHTKRTDPRMLHQVKELQRYQETRRQLRRDMAGAQDEVPEEAQSAAFSASWGMKDEHVMKEGWTQQELAERIAMEIRQVDAKRQVELSQRPAPPSSQRSGSSGKKRGDLAQKASPQHSPISNASARRKMQFLERSAGSPGLSAGTGSAAGSMKASAAGGLSPAVSSPSAPVRTPPVSSMSSEDRNTYMASLSMCLEESGDDADIAKWSFSSFVQPDERMEPQGLDMVLEFLVDKAVRSSSREELCLSIITSYSDSCNAGKLLAESLWRLSEDFMLPPLSGKTACHKRFGGVVGKLFRSSHQWVLRNSEILAGEILALVTLWLEKAKDCLRDSKSAMPRRPGDMYLDTVWEFWSQGQVVLSLLSAPSSLAIRAKLQGLVVADGLDRPVRERLLQMLLGGVDMNNLPALPPHVLAALLKRVRPQSAEKTTQTPSCSLRHSQCQTEELKDPRQGGIERQNSQPALGTGLPRGVTTPSLWAYRTWAGGVEREARTYSNSTHREELKAASMRKLENFSHSSAHRQHGQTFSCSDSDSEAYPQGVHEGVSEPDQLAGEERMDRRHFGDVDAFQFDREEVENPDFGESRSPYYEDDHQEKGDNLERPDGDFEGGGDQDQGYLEPEFSTYAQDESQQFGAPAVSKPLERNEMNEDYGNWREHEYQDSYYDEVYHSDDEVVEGDDDKNRAGQGNYVVYDDRESDNDGIGHVAKWSRFSLEPLANEEDGQVEGEEGDQRWRYEGDALPSDQEGRHQPEDTNAKEYHQPENSGHDSSSELLEDYPDPYAPEKDEPEATPKYSQDSPTFHGNQLASSFASPPSWPPTGNEGAGNAQGNHWQPPSMPTGSEKSASARSRSSITAQWDPMPMFTSKTLTVMAPPPKLSPTKAAPAEVPLPMTEPPEESYDPPLQSAAAASSPRTPPMQGSSGEPEISGAEVMSWSQMVVSSTASASSASPYAIHHLGSGSLSRFVVPKLKDMNSPARMVSMQVPAGLKRTFEERTRWKQADNPSPPPQQTPASSQSPEAEPSRIEEYPGPASVPEPSEALPNLGVGHRVPSQMYSPWLMQQAQEIPVALHSSRLGQFGAIGTRKPPPSGRGRSRVWAANPNPGPHPQWTHSPGQGRGLCYDGSEDFQQFGLSEGAPDRAKPERKRIVDPKAKLQIQKYLLSEDDPPPGEAEHQSPSKNLHLPAAGGQRSGVGNSDCMASIGFDLLYSSGGGSGGGDGERGREVPAPSFVDWNQHGEGGPHFAGHVGQGDKHIPPREGLWDHTSANRFRPIRLPEGREGEGPVGYGYPYLDCNDGERFAFLPQSNGDEMGQPSQSPKLQQQRLNKGRFPRKQTPLSYFEANLPMEGRGGDYLWRPSGVMCDICGMNNHLAHECSRKSSFFT